jgi:hypothetical protein
VARGRDTVVLQLVDLQGGDLLLHRLDIGRDVAQLAIDAGVELREEALQRLHGDLRKPGDVRERHVGGALLAQKRKNVIELLGAGIRHGGSCQNSGLRGQASPHPGSAVDYPSANTASILLFSVCALNGLTM